MTADVHERDQVNTPALQRRTLLILLLSAIPAGSASSATFPTATLLADEVTGNATLAGVAGVGATLGAALTAVPLARRMAARGRRPGLRAAYGLAAIGGLLGVIAAIAEIYLLIIVAMICIGASSAANLAARFAAVDLVDEERRARMLGFLVWGTMFGSVAGPFLGLDLGGRLALSVGLPELAGPYMFATIGLTFASLSIERFLRPDPLVVIDGLTDPDSVEGRRGVGAAFQRIFETPDARLAVGAMAIGHAVMVGIMTMTPLHMKNGEHELRIIGLVISLHVVGMYAFSPLVGWLVDKAGPKPMIGAAGLISFAGSQFAGNTASHESAGVFIGLFLVGLGWSFGLISGSSLLTSTFDPSERVVIQGAADLSMAVLAVAAGLGAGAVVALRNYHDLGLVGGGIALIITAATIWSLFRDRGDRSDPTPAV